MTNGPAPSMLDLDEGFLALPRRLCASAFFRSLRADERFVIVTMLLRAQWAPGEFFFGGRRYSLPVGSFIDSEDAIAAVAGSTRKTVRTVIRKAVAAGLITRAKAHPAGQCPHVTTVCGYERITFDPAAAGQRTGLPLGHEGAKSGPTDGPLTGHQWAPSNKGTRGTMEPGNTSSPSPAAPPPEKRGRKNRREPDPRHRPLQQRLEAIFSEVRGEPYVFGGGRDAKAISSLLHRDVDEVERRWRRALELGTKYPGCATIALLPGRWNELSAATPRANGASRAAIIPASAADAMEEGAHDFR